MAGKPNQEMADGAQKPRRKVERLGTSKRRPQTIPVAEGYPIQPEAILESITDGFFVLDKDWRCTYINKTGAASLQAAPEELIGKTIWEAFSQPCHMRFQEECTRALEQNTIVEFEEYYAPLERWYECRCRPSNGGLTVFLADITEHRRIEAALRESERAACQRLAEMEALYNSAHIGLCVLDRELRFARVNDRFAEMNGLPAGEHVGRTFREVTPDLADAAEELAERIFHTGEPALHVELAGATPARPGIRRHWIEHWLPVKNERGEVVGINVTADEITTEKERHDALQDSEQRLRLVLDGGRMGRWEWDIQTDSMFWCQRVYDLFGVDVRMPATGEAFLSRVHPQDGQGLDLLIERTLADQTDLQAEFRVIRGLEKAHGEVVWLALRGKVIRDERGRPVRMLGVLYDVTDRKQMEAELLGLNERLEEEVHAQTEEMRSTIDRLQDEVARRVLAEGKLRKRSQMLEAFFRHTITPLAFMDRSFNFIRVNEAYAKADGKTPEYFAGRNHFMLFPDVQMREIFEQVVRTRQPYRAYARPFTYPDGPQRVRYWNWRLTPLLADSGEVRYLVFNLEDVTSQQQAIQELQQRAYQLQQLTLELSQAEDRERKRLAEMLHDDLQQVLAAAKFHLGMLNTRIRGDVHLQELVDQIGDLLKEAIGKSRGLSHELSPAVLYQSDLGETFEWLARQVEAKHGLIVHVEIRGRIDPRSEPIRAFLYKAAQEMLFNVVKHAGVTEARLRLQRVRGCVWLTISDRGRGFDPGTLGKTGGFGLLSIRERVQLLGGRMRIKSSMRKGSTFLISVPDQEIASSEGAVKLAPVKAVRELKTIPSCVEMTDHRLRVLLVDDHKIVREGLVALLGPEQDIDIVGQAANGREAVEMTNDLQPDVVVMDVAMPVMGGDEATRHIKRHLPQTRVIALSMFAERSVAEKMHKAGADTYLLKTSPAEELLSAIRGVRRDPDPQLAAEDMAANPDDVETTE